MFSKKTPMYLHPGYNEVNPISFLESSRLIPMIAEDTESYTHWICIEIQGDKTYAFSPDGLYDIQGKKLRDEWASKNWKSIADVVSETPELNLLFPDFDKAYNPYTTSQWRFFLRDLKHSLKVLKEGTD